MQNSEQTLCVRIYIWIIWCQNVRTLTYYLPYHSHTALLYFLQAQERPATLILTLTSGLFIMRAHHVCNRDAETGSWIFVLQLRTIRIRKMCQSQKLVTWDADISVTWKFADIVTTVCYMGPTKITRAHWKWFFFSLELELGTYRNLYLFESSTKWLCTDIFTFRVNKSLWL